MDLLATRSLGRPPVPPAPEQRHGQEAQEHAPVLPALVLVVPVPGQVVRAADPVVVPVGRIASAADTAGVVPLAHRAQARG